MGRLNRVGRLVASALVGLAVGGAPAGADDDDHERAKALKEAGHILPLTDILARAHEVRPGRVLETELDVKHGRYRYELEILGDDGVVWELIFDARTGEWLGEREDDE